MTGLNLYDYNKDEIKEKLDIDTIFDLLVELHAEPTRMNDNILVCLTVCHGGDSHKLYFYENTRLFHCFTGCEDPTFDIFELVRKVKSRETGYEWDLPKAIDFVAKFFNISSINRITEEDEIESLKDWKILSSYDRINNINLNTQEIELKEYDGSILTHLPRPLILPWVEENISEDVMNKRNIFYDPKNCGIVIPHYDINNRLIGVRERAMIEEEAELRGKYRPAYINKQLYNHPLSYNLYNLNWSKDNIKKIKKAIVFEGEKSCLKYATMFGLKNDISVACCGSSLISYQAWLLISLGVDEIIIGLDKQYKELNDKEFEKLTKNLIGIHKKYGNYVKISFLFDKENILKYKESPVDNGINNFLYLFKNRENLYENTISV